jgi:hypothetical protein
LLAAPSPPPAAADEVGASISCSPVAALAAWTQQLQQSPEDLELQQRQREQLAEQLVSTAARLAEQKRRMQLDGLSAAQSSRRRQRRRLDASSTFPHQQHRDQQQQGMASRPSRHQAGDRDAASCDVSLAELEAEMSEIRRALEPELDLLHEVDAEQQQQQQQQQEEADQQASEVPQVLPADIQVQQQEGIAAASDTCMHDNLGAGAAGVAAPDVPAAVGHQQMTAHPATQSRTDDLAAADLVFTPTASSGVEARPASLHIDDGVAAASSRACSRAGSRRTSESGLEEELYCETPASHTAAASTSSSVTRSSGRSTGSSGSGSTGSGSFHATFQGLMHQLQAVAERSLQDSVQLSQQQGQQQVQQPEVEGGAAAAADVEDDLLHGGSSSSSIGGVAPSQAVSPSGLPPAVTDRVHSADKTGAAAGAAAAPRAAAAAAADHAQPAAVGAWYQVASAHSLLAAQAGVAGLQQLFALKEELQGLAKSSSSKGRRSRAAEAGPLPATPPGVGLVGHQQRTSKRRRDHTRVGGRSLAAGPSEGEDATAQQLPNEVTPTAEAAAEAAAMGECGEPRAQQDARQEVAELPMVLLGTPPSAGAGSSRRRSRCLATTPGDPSSQQVQVQHSVLWRQVQQERQQHIATLQRYATLLQEKQGLQQLLHHQEVELELLRSMQVLQKMRAEQGSQVPAPASSTSAAARHVPAEEPGGTQVHVRLMVSPVDPGSDAAAAGRILEVQLLVEEQASREGPGTVRPSSRCSVHSGSSWSAAAGCEDTPWAGLLAGSTPATSRSPSPGIGHQHQPGVEEGDVGSAAKEGLFHTAAAAAAEGVEQCLQTPVAGPGRQHTAVSPIPAEGDGSPSGDSSKAAQLCEQLVLLQVRVQELEAQVEVADKMRKQATTALRAYEQQQQQNVGVSSSDDTSLPQPTPRGSSDASLVTKLHSQNRWAHQAGPVSSWASDHCVDTALCERHVSNRNGIHGSSSSSLHVKAMCSIPAPGRQDHLVWFNRRTSHQQTTVCMHMAGWVLI